LLTLPTQWQFYNASSGTYSSTAPPSSDTTTDIIATPDGLNTATFYYSYYHNTYVSLVHAGYYGVYVSYSMDGKSGGKWSPLTLITNIFGDAGCEQYGGKNENSLPYSVSASALLKSPTTCLDLIAD